MKKNENKIQKFEIGGVGSIQCIRKGELVFEETKHNIVVDQGLLHILGMIGNKDTIITNRYIGLFSGAYVPVPEDTAATFPGDATEFTGYSETTRQLWDLSAIVGSPTGPLTNVDNKAEFTISSDATITGVFLTSAAAKSATTGVLLSAIEFDTPRNVLIGDILIVTYILNISSIE